jgi:hypothetical protein
MKTLRDVLKQWDELDSNEVIDLLVHAGLKIEELNIPKGTLYTLTYPLVNESATHVHLWLHTYDRMVGSHYQTNDEEAKQLGVRNCQTATLNSLNNMAWRIEVQFYLDDVHVVKVVQDRDQESPLPMHRFNPDDEQQEVNLDKFNVDGSDMVFVSAWMSGLQRHADYTIQLCLSKGSWNKIAYIDRKDRYTRECPVIIDGRSKYIHVAKLLNYPINHSKGVEVCGMLFTTMPDQGDQTFTPEQLLNVAQTILEKRDPWGHDPEPDVVYALVEMSFQIHRMRIERTELGDDEVSEVLREAVNDYPGEIYQVMLADANGHYPVPGNADFDPLTGFHQF